MFLEKVKKFDKIYLWFMDVEVLFTFQKCSKMNVKNYGIIENFENFYQYQVKNYRT